MASQPKPPDPYKQASAQQGAELTAAQASAIINNPNQVNPYGTQTNKVIGWETVYDAKGKPVKVPRYQTTTTLSKEQQGLLNLQNQTMSNIGQLGVQQSGMLQGLLSKPVSTAGLSGWQTYGKAPAMKTGYGSGGAIQKQLGSGGAIRQDQGRTDRAAIERAALSRSTRDMQRQNAAEDVQLAARGMNPGARQYSTIDEERARQRTDAVNQAYLLSGQESRAAQEAYNQAQNQRFTQGGARGAFANAAQAQANAQNAAAAGFYNQGAQQNFANSAQWSDLMNQLRGGQLQERMALRNQPLNEIAALMSGSQVTAPQFQAFSRQGINAAPVGQYIGQNYANQAQAANQFNQGLFGLGGAGLGAYGSWLGSDRRIKQDIVSTGYTLAGCPLYRFRYIGRPGLWYGVMSDEVRELHPDAVTNDNGFDLVDYGVLMERAA